MVYWVKLPPTPPASHMADSFGSYSSNSDPVPCLGKAEEDVPNAWAPSSKWETWKKLWVSGS